MGGSCASREATELAGSVSAAGNGGQWCCARNPRHQRDQNMERMVRVVLLAPEGEPASNRARLACRNSYSSLMSVSPDHRHLDREYTGRWHKVGSTYWLILAHKVDYAACSGKPGELTALAQACLVKLETRDHKLRIDLAPSLPEGEPAFAVDPGPFDNEVLRTDLGEAAREYDANDKPIPFALPMDLEREAV